MWWSVLIIKTPPMQKSLIMTPGHQVALALFYNRARDQQFVLNYFAEADERQLIPGLKERVDTNNAAIIGHSMGGFGAINTVGGCYAFNSDNLKKIGVPTILANLLPFRLNSCFAGQEKLDPRWKAIQVFAPWVAN